MRYGLSDQTIQQINSIFTKHPTVKQAVLYGSRAKGNYKPGSDIDLTLFGEDLSQQEADQILEELDAIDLPHTIDLSVFKNIVHAKLRDHIARVGVVFYQRDKKPLPGRSEEESRWNCGAANGQHGISKMNQGGRTNTLNSKWKHKPLGNVCKLIGGGTPPKGNDAYYKGDIPWATVRDMKNTYITETEFKITPEAVLKSATNIIKAGNVVIATRVGLGKVCIISLDTAINQDLKGILPINDKEIDKKYLYWWLKSVSKHIEDEGTGATVKGVKLPFVRSLMMPLPSIFEQRRIVAILDDIFERIDNTIVKTEKNLANAKELFESNLKRIFIQKGEGWEEKCLAEIAQEFGRGKSRHRPRNDPKLYGGQYPFIQTGDLSGAQHFLRNYSQTYSEEGLAQSRLWPKGTVCIAIVGATVGETAILGFDACFPDSVIGIVVNKNLANNEYVEYLLQSFKSFLKEKGKGTARDNINMGTFENQLFPFPPMPIQKNLVARLNVLHSECSKLATIYKNKYNFLLDLKQSILQKAFSGELTADFNPDSLEH